MLTATQVTVLDSQISAMSDEELVRFYEANHNYFEAEGAEAIMEKASEAYDRLQKAAEALATTIAEERVVELTEAEAVEAEAEELAEEVVDPSVKEEETVTRFFAGFLGNIERAVALADAIKSAPKFGRQRMLDNAWRFHNRALSTRWAAWSLKALERLMEKEGSVPSDLLLMDRELAATVGAAPKFRKAKALIGALEERSRQAIGRVHLGPMRTGKTARDKANKKSKPAE